MKEIVRQLLRRVGYEIVATPKAPRSRCRALGGHQQFLHDMRGRGFSPNVILDVGANRGEWARMAAAEFPNAKFILIEPQPEMHDALRSFLAAKPGSVLHAVAAGAEETTLPMTILPGGDGSTFVLSEQEALAARYERRAMPVRTIDAILRESDMPPPELAKLDIQGFEIPALQGASMLMGMTEVFVLEVSFFVPESRGTDFAAVVRFMNDAGYKLYDFCGFLPRPFDHALGQADAIFVRKDGFFRRHLGWS
jgi:FkbM family methyltransferase